MASAWLGPVIYDTVFRHYRTGREVWKSVLTWRQVTMMSTMSRAPSPGCGCRGR